MKRKALSLFFVMLLLCAQAPAALANDLAGKWTGTLSAGAYQVEAKVKFTDSSFVITAASISSSGSYTLSDGSITLTPSSPPGFSASTMAISLKGNRCTISGLVCGINGTLKLKRKGGSTKDKSTAEPTASPSPSPTPQRTLDQFTGRWTAQRTGGSLTLMVYGDGWAALFLDGEVNPEPWIYGRAEMADGHLVIRQAAVEADRAEPADLFELLSTEERPAAPLAVSLALEFKPESNLLYAGEESLPFVGEDGAADAYMVHPEEPDWTEKE